MQTREKIILCTAGYLVAVGLWFGVAQGALSEAQARAEELENKKKEATELSIKLKDKVHLQKEHDDLTRDIEQVRGSVPKNPDIDLLVIDLEKMCLDSGLDLVSVEEPDKEKLRASEAAGEEPASLPQPKVSGAVSGGPAAAKPEGPKIPLPGDKNKPGSEVDTGLVKHFLLVSAQGSYAGAIELMKKLESYQRVIGVSQVDIGFPTESKEQKEPDPNQLKISFLMTAYYLP